MIWLLIVSASWLVQVLIILFSEFRHPSKCLSWLLVLFIFPMVGFVMYWFVAKEYPKHHPKMRSSASGEAAGGESQRRYALGSEFGGELGSLSGNLPMEGRLYSLLSKLPDFSATDGNRLLVYQEAEEAYEAILKAMEQAKHHIHIEVYTIRDDGIGRRFQECMVRKAREGVQVRLVYDGIGSVGLKKRYLAVLEEAGVETASFLPLVFAFLSKRLNYRNHRKTIVVDGSVGFLGGMNIGDEYLGKDPKLGYWRDSHFQVDGPAVNHLQRVFASDWTFAADKSFSGIKYYPEISRVGDEPVQIVVGGPDRCRGTLFDVYFAALSTAQRRIYIATPYFIPESSLHMALRSAAASGVDVRIIIPTIPDSKLVHWASVSFARELMADGVRFYLYEKGFMHSKLMIIDDSFAAVGTMNLDVRSFFSNFELGALLFRKDTVRGLEEEFFRDLACCRELTREEYAGRSAVDNAKEALARLLSSLL